jgi:hypothetical protein
MSVITGQQWRSLAKNLWHRGSKRRRSTIGTTDTTDIMARVEHAWATATNLKFLIRRGLTPQQAFIVFDALNAQPDLRRYGPLLLMLAYQTFLFLLPYGLITQIAAAGALFALLIGRQIFLRRSVTHVINRLVATLAESLVTFIEPAPEASLNFFPGEGGRVAKKLADKQRKLRKLAFQVAEGLAVLDGSPRRNAGGPNCSDCARVILWGADQIWDKRRVAQAVDTIIEQLKHILGASPHIPLRFSLRNDFPELPSRSRQYWVSSLDEPFVKVVAAPLLITVVGVGIAAVIRILFG